MSAILQLIYLLGSFLGLCIGAAIGYKIHGMTGAIGFALIGSYLGAMLGKLPSSFANKALINNLERSSNEQLIEIIARQPWQMYQSMALSKLASRGVDVKDYLPRLKIMLSSDQLTERTIGWEAIKMVFPATAKQLADYNPQESAEICQQKLARSNENKH